ncbi:tRNA (adenosine(37)-N6)-dimethylallyltransferase MiaA [Sphingomonas sp. CARO-RG-8B-R24-01]|uniref:tRNA (adenosine(37)-N6)-dimethylallyltransferase MiaA n=1 Tax=Sphingomonas sp. CARO-RG-8B-R24-01 TaxID=2914831 RepID=UPI001F56AE9C|nr:tRNA (adenosine(37)-N6)-dimethylallyltransferase MiaA [Sphingomonas sp. CARO-RG-8B-R24-01]
MNTVDLPKLALIAGPTASGKSALAIAVAERHDGIVINADSAQVYRDLRILTARPSPADEARVPHRLFGYIDGAEACSAARWADAARAEVAAAQAAGKLPVLVGGTGLYLRTLLDGIAPVPEIDPAIRAAVRAMPVAKAHAALTQADPAAAARLAAADTTRVARALEVVRSTGRPLAAWQAERSGGIAAKVAQSAVVLLPERDWLFERCDARAAAMFDDGAAEEVRILLQRNDIPDDAPIRRAIGVPALAAFVAGAQSREQTLEALRLATRQYAKRQYTWFRNQPPPSWAKITESQSSDRMLIFDRLFQL